MRHLSFITLIDFTKQTAQRKQLYAKFHAHSKLSVSLVWDVGTRGRAEGSHAPPFFDRSVTLINQGGRLCPPQYYSLPLKFSHLPTSLFALSWVQILAL